MSAGRQATGHTGETEAVRYLLDRGFEVLERNVRTPYGELDIVAREGDEIVFVEVKAGMSLTYGMPQERVTARKQRKLTENAQAYIQRHGLEEHGCRFDVVGIVLGRQGGVRRIDHIRGAFLAGED